MPKTEIERIAVLETRVDAVQRTLKDIDNKLDLLPEVMAREIKNAIEHCREMQLARCGMMQKENLPVSKSAITGWTSAVAMGIGLAAKTLGWW